MAKPGSGSQQKGKNFERSVAKKLTETFGVQFRRTPSPERWKSTNKGDINASRHDKTIAHDFFWEAKARESWSIIDWYKKAKDDAGTFQIPIVVATRNHEEDYAFLRFDDFLRILKELEGYRKEDPLN